jgi:hypothetical protein
MQSVVPCNMVYMCYVYVERCSMVSMSECQCVYIERCSQHLQFCSGQAVFGPHKTLLEIYNQGPAGKPAQ